MNTFETLNNERYHAVSSLRMLGGDPVAICKAVDKAYTKNENPFAEMLGQTNEEMALSEAYGKIQEEVLERWTKGISREAMLAILSAIYELPYGVITYIPGESINAEQLMSVWNAAHPDEPPIRLNEEAMWSN